MTSAILAEIVGRAQHLAGPSAVRSTQFGAGETVVVTEPTMLETGYGWPLHWPGERQ